MVTVNIDKSLISHLFRRAGFGITENKINLISEKSYENIVEDLLNPDRFPEIEEDLLRRYRMELNFPDTHDGWQSHWIYKMINTERPLEEKITLFWHHIFATSIGKSEHTPSSVEQIRTFRKNGLSNMKRILLDLAKDPAMLFWLDNCENHNGEPNENWGRELLELFSMGVGNYTEEDIKNASRAFTGWTFVQPLPLDPYARYDSDFLYIDEDHDHSEKIFLGQKGNFNGEDIIDIIVKQPATAKFISRHLYNFFVADEPQVPAWDILPPQNQDAIDGMVKVYLDSDGDIKEILRFMFNSNFFKESKFKKVKSPVELVTGIIKINGQHKFPGIEFPSLSASIAGMGQMVMVPPTVEGWHTGKEWIDGGTLNERVNFAVDNIRGKAQSVSSILGNNDAYDKLDTLTVDLPSGIKEIVEKIKNEKISDSENLLNRCLELLGHIEINDSTRKEFIAEIDKKDPISFSSKKESLSTEENIITLLQAIVSTIEFQFG